MPIEDFKTILGKLKTIGITQVTITGGEPTEHPQFLEFVSLAAKHFVLHVCTHGDWDQDYSTAMFKAGVTQVQFNYQGSKHHDRIHKVHKSYQRQIESIAQCIKAGLETVCTVTVGAYNLKTIDAIFAEINTLGIDRLRVWETTGRGNSWRKDIEAKEIFEHCKTSAANMDFNFIQSYDPEMTGDINAHCPAMMKMYMYITSKSKLMFCAATDQIVTDTIACFINDDPLEILLKYGRFMDNISEGGIRCMARQPST
jgi:MoaA/NifB/PqqE/SkfB family radical SAM enzyme